MAAGQRMKEIAVAHHRDPPFWPRGKPGAEAIDPSHEILARLDPHADCIDLAAVLPPAVFEVRKVEYAEISGEFVGVAAHVAALLDPLPVQGLDGER